MKKRLRNKRIVLLGENSHTIGDYYTLKTRLVRFLHHEMGFDVFTMESGIADVFTVYSKLDSTSADELMRKTLFANLRTKEMMPLFDYLKRGSNSKKRLEYYGFDSQNHGASLTLIKEVLSQYYGSKADVLIDDLNKYFQIPQLAWQPDKKPVTDLAETIRKSASTLLEMLRNIKVDLISKNKLSEMHINILERSLANHRDAVSLNWQIESPLEKRDALMADNIVWLANEVFPGKKFIIWGHNTHIDKGGTDVLNRSMGFHLKERMKDKTYHIGLYARKGELYWWYTKETRSFDQNDRSDIEVFADKHPITFLDFSKNGRGCKPFSENFTGFEAEFGRKVAFVPANRYDAIINFRQVSASTY